MRFSERYRFKQVREFVQIDSVDEPLRNGLWNVLQVFVWDNTKGPGGFYAGYHLSDPGNQELRQLCHALWLSYFREPLDQLDNNWTKTLREIRGYYFECAWYEVYDFIEFVANHFAGVRFKESFMFACNKVLQRELSAYRFVNGLVTQVTEQKEIEGIESALDKAVGPVHSHLRRALELLADRNTPDYRNSIKESISAVESLSVSIIGETGTLGQLVKKLDQQISLHPALKCSISNLYGYTSDEGGIRHALLEEETADLDHAKFMLVVCSAFVSFVLSKLNRAG